MALRLMVLSLIGVGVGVGVWSLDSSQGCVAVPQSIATDRLVDGGTRLTVPAGAVVYDVLVEADDYIGGPGFPWLAPRSSNRAVLVPVTLCRGDTLSTLPVRVTGFRAVSRGTATLDAALVPRWRSIKPRPAGSLNRVTVR
jgi:hypothetical protein